MKNSFMGNLLEKVTKDRSDIDNVIPKHIKLTKKHRILRSEQHRKAQAKYMREAFGLSHGGSKQNKRRRKKK